MHTTVGSVLASTDKICCFQGSIPKTVENYISIHLLYLFSRNSKHVDYVDVGVNEWTYSTNDIEEQWPIMKLVWQI